MKQGRLAHDFCSHTDIKEERSGVDFLCHPLEATRDMRNLTCSHLGKLIPFPTCFFAFDQGITCHAKMTMFAG